MYSQCSITLTHTPKYFAVYNRCHFTYTYCAWSKHCNYCYHVPSQIKSIARYKAHPNKIDEKDTLVIASVYAIERDGSHYSLSPKNLLGIHLLISAFVFINTMVAVLICYLLYSHHEEMLKEVKKNRYYHSLYWAVVFVACGVDILCGATFTLSLIVGQLDLFSDDITKGAFITKVVLIFIFLALELILAMIVTCRKTQNTNDEPQKLTVIVADCCKQVFAIFSIIAFVHNISAAVIPLSAFFIVFPGQILSFVIFMCSSLLCLVIFVAHILYLDYPDPDRSPDSDRSNKPRKNIQIIFRTIFVLLFIGLIGILVIFYLQLLSRGVHENGLVNFLISLTPSGFMLFIFQRVLKRLQVKKAHTNTVE